MKIFYKILIIGILLTIVKSQVHIRTNQIGYGENDLKSAIILSKEKLDGLDFSIKTFKNKDKVSSSKITNKKGSYGNFPYVYEIDFSDLNKNGVYQIEIKNNKSLPITIGTTNYKKLVEDLLFFFKIQRCGYTNPEYRKDCHISDATSLIDNGKTYSNKIDVTGGWHDAGDYIKFLNTTAYTTYMLLFAYDFDPVTFGFDNDKNNVADILEEAKIGLDWMHRCFLNPDKLIVQVQDTRDQTVGWRLPENDPLAFDRPAFTGIGKNLIGIYAATMALATKIWGTVLNYKEYSESCAKVAFALYANKDNVPDISKDGTGAYIDDNYLGKLALGAIELYNITKNEKFLDDAKKYATEAGSDFWWSWGNINSLAHYRIAKYDISFADYIEKNLLEFERHKDTKVFNEATTYSWGTNNTLLGVSIQSILWNRLTGKDDFNNLSSLQRDYVLGRNPWGLSFVQGNGYSFSKEFHHQIAYLKKVKLKGGFAAGPISKKVLDSYNIPFEKKDRLIEFQTEEAVYRDDRMDFVTNEPTITANATAIFVFGYYLSKK